MTNMKNKHDKHEGQFNCNQLNKLKLNICASKVYYGTEMSKNLKL